MKNILFDWCANYFLLRQEIKMNFFGKLIEFNRVFKSNSINFLIEFDFVLCVQFEFY